MCRQLRIEGWLDIFTRVGLRVVGLGNRWVEGSYAAALRVGIAVRLAVRIANTTRLRLGLGLGLR